MSAVVENSFFHQSVAFFFGKEKKKTFVMIFSRSARGIAKRTKSAIYAKVRGFTTALSRFSSIWKANSESKALPIDNVHDLLHL